MKWTLHILMFLLIGFSSIAQTELPMTRKAARFALAGDLAAARTISDQAVKSSEGIDAYAWFTHGYIYKEIFKKIENESINSDNRETAINSILKSRELDTKGQYSSDIKKALEYLAYSYYNQGVTMIESHDPQWLEQAEGFFDRFEKVLREVDPMVDLTQTRVTYLKSLAQGYEKVFDHNPKKEEYIREAIAYYEKAISISPQDYEANYNVAIDYYNQGVHRIKRINHDTEIFELIVIQEECIQLFKLSLPYMLKAHAQNPQRRETLVGLMAIYRALNEDELSNQYKDNLTQLIESGVIDKH